MDFFSRFSLDEPEPNVNNLESPRKPMIVSRMDMPVAARSIFCQDWIDSPAFVALPPRSTCITFFALLQRKVNNVE